MPLFEREADAVRYANPDEFIVAIKWQGEIVAFATVTEPHLLPAPEIVVMQRLVQNKMSVIDGGRRNGKTLNRKGNNETN